jgi:type IV secretory pathway VirB4 component
MIKVAAAINSFASQATQTDFVPPSEESVFILTSGQLQDIIKEAVQPLQDRIEFLEATLAAQYEKIQTLEATQAHMEENQLIQLRLIADLRKGQEPQPMQKDRGEILRALIAVNGGKMLATEARKKMHLSRSRFSELLATVKDEIEVKPYHLNKSWIVLVLR